MAVSFMLNADIRDTVGSSIARRMREQHRVPGVVYGGEAKPVKISMDQNELLTALQHEAIFSHILKLKVAGKQQDVVLKDLQRHPVKPFIMHVDFYRVSAKEELRMSVPLHYLNEEESPGVKAGGIVSRTLNEIEISCLPKDLPEAIEVDISALDVNDSLSLSDVKLPGGVKLVHEITEDNDPTIVSVYIPREEPVEEEVVAEAAEEGATEATDASAEQSTEEAGEAKTNE